MKIFSLLTLAVVLVALRLEAQIAPLEHAHAHNDYEQERPLLDALENGFISVEADVYAVNNELYVYHHLPETFDDDKTLEKLYLKPLAEIIKADGYIYKNYTGFFYLMIDFKTEAHKTYEQVEKLLLKYSDYISTVTEGQDESGKPIKVFISGNRPFDEILNSTKQIAALDGRPDDLGKGIPAAIMPVVSENFNRFSTWKGNGKMKAKECRELKAFIDCAHGEGKKVRFWATPDMPEAWAFFLDIGVDFINTDKLVELRQFLMDRGDRK